MTPFAEQLLVVLALMLAAVFLAGCAAQPAAPAVPDAPRTFSGICALKGIGQSEEGVTFVLAHCEEKKP